MPAIQLPLGAPQLHYNQQLFSDYYLDRILPERADWKLLAGEAAPVLAQLRALYAGFTPSSIEAQTEDDLIKPALAALGHGFEVQAALRTPDGTKKPDYVFYRDLPARDANKGKTLDDSLPAQGAIAVGDAKFWERPLDSALKTKGGDPFTNKNPSYQIAFYIQHSGLPWGILTNGRRWRLYHKDSAHKLDRFYEVDLPELLERNDPEAFLYFYAFFRRAAFDEHELGLATLLRASAEVARGIGDNLKQQVYSALRHLAQGFLDYGPNQLQPDPAALKQIYDHCLIVLYRLLFVLYAEARELLPLRESEPYRRAYSLEAIKRSVAETLDSALPLLPDSATLWPRLRTLFGIINAGSPPLKVSTFNGGLFDPRRYPFLERNSIGDARLLQALDLLTRVSRQFVDYRDLAERHLGTIYEGLLEYHLAPLEGPHPPGLLLPQGEKGEEGRERIVIDRTLQRRMVEVARNFRKEPTPSEALLWQALRDCQLDGRRFRRQQPIGPFIVDFFCAAERLIVEVDGPIHASQYEADRQRQSLLEAAGYRVVRVSSADVEQNLPSALATIRAAFIAPHPPGPLLPQGEKGEYDQIEQQEGFGLPSPARGEGRGGEGQRGFGAAAPPSPAQGEGRRGGEGHRIPRRPEDAGFSVALVNSEGERHRTGSYYTPDFVVQYIVEQTLRPILDAAVAGKRSDEEKVAAVLAVNVLDLSMGSGHFPVAATEYIARYLIDLNVSPGADAGGEADLPYWKRRVAQSCIYGVDLNPLAVDLAKLSLWLATAAKDKPLSFLDHHLRCGNAVVGVRLSDLDLSGARPRRRRSAPPPPLRERGPGGEGQLTQLSMLDDGDFTRSMSTAVGSMWLIERTAGNTVAEVKEQEQAYAAVRAELTRRYAHIADLATAAQGFGLTVDGALWPELVRQASRGRETIMLPAIARMLEQAEATADAQRFFHWDLEFPEVFFDRFGRPLGEAAGFDAVIGNPPYVRQEQLAPYKGFLAAAFPETYHGAADLFVYFYHQGLRLLREGGRLSYIVTNKWLRSGYGEPLRGYFAQHARIERLIDFGHAPIFEDADVFPCIIVLEKPAAGDDPGEQQVQVTAFPREALRLVQLDGYVQRYSHPVPQRRLGRAAWSLESAEVEALMEKVRRGGVPLADFVGVKPLYGIKSGLTEAYVIDTPTRERLIEEDPACEALIKPYVRGQDMARWETDYAQLWLIVLKSSNDHRWPWSAAPNEAEQIFAQTYPSLYRHLKSFEGKLRKRQDKGTYWWELRACAYYDRFERPKIFYPDITWRSNFSLDTHGRFANNTVYFLSTSSPWVLTVLNSPLLWSYCWREAVHGKDEALRFFTEFVERIPIAPATDDVLAEVEPAAARLVAIARANQEARRETLDWLRLEFGVEQPGQKLAELAALDEAAFLAEVKKRRPRAVGALTPAGLKALRAGYGEQATPAQQRAGEALALERRLAELVNAAYGLTAEDVALLWRTAPPRMPAR